jgi:hypothetical protein
MEETCGDRPLLGAVLVAQGAVAHADVELALDAQTETSQRVGELLVDLGLICRPELDRALAWQSGVIVDEESGFGSGLRAAIERRHRYRRDFAISEGRPPSVGPKKFP